MLEFHPVNSRSIGVLHVEIIEQVIEAVNDPHPDRMRVGVQAPVYAVDVQVVKPSNFPADFQLNVNLEECVVNFPAVTLVVDERFPERIVAEAVEEGYGIAETKQVVIRDRNTCFTVGMKQVFPKRLLQWEHRFLETYIFHNP